MGENVGKHSSSSENCPTLWYETCQCLIRLYMHQCFDSAVSLLGIYAQTTRRTF